MTSHAPKYHWSFEGYFNFLLRLLAGVGFGMLALAGQIDWLAALLFLIPYSLLYIPSWRLGIGLSARVANWMVGLYFPLFLFDTFYWSLSFIPATLHLILFMLLLKLYQPKTNRDHFQIILLVFLQVLAASSLTISATFVLGFLVFVLISLALLIAFEIHRQTASWLGSSREATLGEGVFALKLQQQAGKTIVAISVLGLFAIMGASTLIFFALPRFGSGYFSRVQRQNAVLSGFTDQIRLGGIGKIQLDPSIVMRVQVADGKPLPPGAKWRGMTLDQFDGRNWSKRLRRGAISFKPARSFKVQDVPMAGQWLHYQVLMEPADTGYLFTLDRIANLEGRLFPLIFDPSDQSLTTRAHPNQRLLYEGDSCLPDPARQGSIPGFSELRNPETYLKLPLLDPRIEELAKAIAPSNTPPEILARTIESYLQKNYAYSLAQAEVEVPQPLVSFLFETRKGHCEYFASAMAVLLRYRAVPSRIVNGFQPGEYNEVGQDYVIRGSDAHSWVEAFLPGKGWQAFDPTPPSAGAPADSYIYKTFFGYWDALEFFWGQWILPYDDMLQASLFTRWQQETSRWRSEGRQQMRRRLEDFALVANRWSNASIGWVTRHGRLILAILAGGGAWGALLLVLGKWLHWKWQWLSFERHGARATATGLYQEMLHLLRKKGKIKGAMQTPNEFAMAISEEYLQKPVLTLTALYNQARFGSPGSLEIDEQQAWQLLNQLRKARDPKEKLKMEN